MQETFSVMVDFTHPIEVLKESDHYVTLPYDIVIGLCLLSEGITLHLFQDKETSVEYNTEAEFHALCLNQFMYHHDEVLHELDIHSVPRDPIVNRFLVTSIQVLGRHLVNVVWPYVQQHLFQRLKEGLYVCQLQLVPCTTGINHGNLYHYLFEVTIKDIPALSLGV